MAIADLVARLTLNARNFTSGLDQSINDATRRARAGGRAIGESLSGAANAGLNDLANRIPIVGGAIAALGPAALLAGAGVGALGVALVKGVTEADAYAKEINKLNAVLTATGNTTGLTSQQLETLASDLEGPMAIAAEEFLAAERQLATFGGVAGSVFKDVIALSADLAATFGGDVVSNTEKLGLAMEGLAQGNVAPLSKAFKFLGTETIATITALSDQGKAFEAQQALIEALRGRIGGAGAAGGDNLTGDFFRLADAVGDAAREAAVSSGAYDGWRGTISRTTDAISALSTELDRLKDDDVAGRAAATARFFFGKDTLAGIIPAAPTANLPEKNFAAAGQRLADERAGRTAAESARAEADKRKAAEAAAKALEKQQKAQEAASKAAQAAEKAFAGGIDDLRFQAQLLGKSKDEAEQLTIQRRAQVQLGRPLTAREREALNSAVNELQTRRQILEVRAAEMEYLREAQSIAARKTIDSDFANGISRGPSVSDLDQLRRSNENYFGGFLDVRKADNEDSRRQLQKTSDVFFTALTSGQDGFWSSFQQAGFETAANIAAKLVKDVDLGGTLAAIFGAGSGEIAEGAARGASAGAAISTLFGKSKETQAGGTIGGAVGGATGLPGGELIGAIWGSIIGGAFAKDSFSDAFIATVGGQVSATRIAARGDGRADQAGGLAAAVSQGLQQLAGALGGSVANGVNLGAIGSNKDTFYFNPTGGDFRSGGAQRFADAEQAVEAALRNAVANGALAGVDANIMRLLSQGDFQVQAGKAAALAAALKSFDQSANPFADQVRSLTDEFAQLRDVMAEAGSSTADLSKASSEYDRRLQSIKDAAAAATATLRGFLEGLGFGSSSPLSLGEQRSAALAAYNLQAARIGQSGFDQGAFSQSGQALLDIEGQLFGRTDSFFTTFRQVQDDTRRAIDAIDRAATISGDNPFARTTAAATQATAENTAGMLEQIAGLPAMIGQQIAQSLAALGIGGGGDDRGFVARMAV